MSALRVLPTYLVTCLTIVGLAATAALAVDGNSSRGSWTIEQAAAEPSHAVADTTHTAALKDDPKAVVAVDGQDFPVDLLFADDHAVPADTLQAGKTMTVKLDLLAEPSGKPAMDGEAVVNLPGPGAKPSRPCGGAREAPAPTSRSTASLADHMTRASPRSGGARASGRFSQQGGAKALSWILFFRARRCASRAALLRRKADDASCAMLLVCSLATSPHI